MRDREEYVGPQREVVAAPVAGEGPAAGEGGAADDEGSFRGHDGEEGVVGCVEDLVAEEVVDVVFGDTVVVSGVGGDGVYGEVALHVADDVWGVVDVANTGGGFCDQGGGGHSCCWGWTSGGGVSGGLRSGCRGGGSGFGCVGKIEAFGVVVDEGAGIAGERKGRVDGVHSYIISAAAADTERGGFGHVDPDSVKGDVAVIGCHFVDPPLPGSRT